MFDFIKNLMAPRVTPGLLQDDEAYLEGLPKYEVVVGAANEGALIPDWRRYAPPYFRSQEATMMCTAFAGVNAAYMLNLKEGGGPIVFSPLELFIRANGEIYGNTIENTERAMKQGLFQEGECPWIGPVSDWNPFVLRLMAEYAKAKTRGDLSSAKKFAIKSLVRVMPDRVQMRSALVSSPLIAIVQVSYGYFDSVAPAPTSGALHAVVIERIDPDGKVLVYDSLMAKQGFNGHHWLAADYPILYAFAILDLPNDWETKQDAYSQQRFEFARSRYGRVPDGLAEAKARQTLIEARKTNPTHAAYIDDLREVYVMAMVHGGYSLQDILNHITSLRRGKGAIFDFNSPRSR